MYCTRCKVEVNNTESVCPLCGSRLMRDRQAEAQDARPYPESEPRARAKEKKSGNGIFAFAALVFSVLMSIANIFRAEIAYALPQGADIFHYISLPAVVAVTIAIFFIMLFTLIKKNIQRRFFV